MYYKYHFSFKDGKEQSFEINLDDNTLLQIPKGDKELPEWTLLENFACSHCPLDTEFHLYCPIAQNLSDVIPTFSEMASYEEALITVECEERTYQKKTSVQIGVSGLIGLLMPTSGCPLTAKLKHMARFHLPFASLEETQFRVFSSYMLAQLVKKERGLEPDLELKQLNAIYKDIEKLNVNVAQRIADLEKKDASINAVVVLNNFANYVTITLDDHDLNLFENVFKEIIKP